jgi:LysR family hydrogen peroxide-inducible transcriptional activator
MTLTEMRYVVALARERHFGKAAEACHVSQPTLSVALKKLKGQIGAPLFERGANDVRITPLGERIVAQADGCWPRRSSWKKSPRRPATR